MDFWKKVFGSTGEESWGRVAAGLVVVFGITWITRFVMLISSPADFDKLGHIGVFMGAVTAFASALYGISKGLDVLKDKK